jgi:hypothetical protein
VANDTNELLLIECRPEAPLVRTLRDFDGFPKGTLGYVAGVDDTGSPFIKVRLAGSDGPSVMLPYEVENV